VVVLILYTRRKDFLNITLYGEYMKPKLKAKSDINKKELRKNGILFVPKKRKNAVIIAYKNKKMLVFKVSRIKRKSCNTTTKKVKVNVENSIKQTD
jgi:hypothetical protein